MKITRTEIADKLNREIAEINDLEKQYADQPEYADAVADEINRRTNYENAIKALPVLSDSDIDLILHMGLVGNNAAAFAVYIAKVQSGRLHRHRELPVF